MVFSLSLVAALVSGLLLRRPSFVLSLRAHVSEFLSTAVLELRFHKQRSIDAATAKITPPIIPTPMPVFALVDRRLGACASLVFVGCFAGEVAVVTLLSGGKEGRAMFLGSMTLRVH
jgi:hypothetical protein